MKCVSFDYPTVPLCFYCVYDINEVNEDGYFPVIGLGDFSSITTRNYRRTR